MLIKAHFQVVKRGHPLKKCPLKIPHTRTRRRRKKELEHHRSLKRKKKKRRVFQLNNHNTQTTALANTALVNQHYK